MNKKTYVFDTSTLIEDPTAYKHFPNSDVIIPIMTLEELDNLKKQVGETGKHARVCIKLLDEISELGDISTGILLDNDIILKIDATYYDPTNYSGFGSPTYGDTQILICAYQTWKDRPDCDVVLVSNDINLRLKAKARGIDAIGHVAEGTAFNDLYSGACEIINEKAGMELQAKGQIDAEEFHLFPNECVRFQDAEGNGIVLGRQVGNKIKLVKKHYPWNISARNMEQSFLMDLIMDKNIDLVTAVGSAGTGKSLIALSTAVELVCGRREYEKLIIYRPIQVVGRDIGYIPGDLSEKLAPHFSAIMDNFEVLFGNKNGGDWRKDLEMFQRKGRIEMEAIAFIRGRSIPNSIILVDECQNISKEDVKTILTRAGEGTKLILTGDIEQLDHEDLDAMNNGLTYVIEKFKTFDLAGHITLKQGERSRFASLAAKIL